jgi:hypothetical protein
MPSIASASLPLRHLNCDNYPDNGEVLVADSSFAHNSKILRRSQTHEITQDCCRTMPVR